MDKILGFWAVLGLEGSTELYCGVEKLGMFWWLNRHFRKFTLGILILIMAFLLL
jgi:hypothetical protein